VPIFAATAIAAVHCSAMKHNLDRGGRKPQTASAALFGAAALDVWALEFERGTTATMSALGQKQTSNSRPLMSALPPKADIRCVLSDVRFVP